MLCKSYGSCLCRDLPPIICRHIVHHLNNIILSIINRQIKNTYLILMYHRNNRHLNKSQKLVVTLNTFQHIPRQLQENLNNLI